MHCNIKRERERYSVSVRQTDTETDKQRRTDRDRKIQDRATETEAGAETDRQTDILTDDRLVETDGLVGKQAGKQTYFIQIRELENGSTGTLTSHVGLIGYSRNCNTT